MYNNKDIELQKIYIEHDLKRLYTDSVTDKDKELMSEYISNLSVKELEVFKDIYHDLKYSRKKNYITHNAIQLTLKVYKDTEEKTFPFINKIACKGWRIGEGTFAFSLYFLNNEYNKELYSWWRVSQCLQKRYELDIQNVELSVGDLEITLIDTKEVKNE